MPRHPARMCNLYRMTKGVAEVANLFAAIPGHGANFGAEVYRGYPGAVVAEGRSRTMTWGFPLAMKSKKTGAPLQAQAGQHARENKLATPFWRDSFANRRCLIPVTAWAEAEGEKGRMTRTWHSLPNGVLFAVAGVWRPTAEWGDAYSMVMVDGCEQMADVHDRMPVILALDTWDQWTAGSPEEAFEMVKIWEGVLAIERTPEPWFKARVSSP